MGCGEVLLIVVVASDYIASFFGRNNAASCAVSMDRNNFFSCSSAERRNSVRQNLGQIGENRKLEQNIDQIVLRRTRELFAAFCSASAN